jgi:Ni/Co efflux regulator RcnB
LKVRLLMTGGLICLLGITAGAIRAQDHGQDQDHHDQDRHDQDHMRFDDHDRQVSRDWYNAHHDHPPMGLREQDRLRPEYEARLQNGYVFDRYMRSRIHPVPADYYSQLPPPPRGYRYVLVGGHAVLIDGDYRVHDVIHFELNF